MRTSPAIGAGFATSVNRSGSESMGAGASSTQACIAMFPPISNADQALELRLLIHQLNQCIDIAERVGERLCATCVAGNLRNVIRHHHAIVADLFVRPHSFDEIDV